MTKQLSLFNGQTLDPEIQIPEAHRKIGEQRAELIELYESMREIYKGTHRPNLAEDFLRAFNGGEFVFMRLREQLGSISRATLYGWSQAYREGGLDALIPGYVIRTRKITKAERRCLTEILADHAKIGQAIMITKYFLKRKGIESPSSPATLRRWANKEGKKENA